MTAGNQSRGRRRWRSFWRGLRIALLLLIFFVIAAGTYLNEVGVPGFIKRPLLAKLRERGVDAQFTRLRLRWYRGFVAENVQLGEANPRPGAPRFSAREADVKLDGSALAGFTFKVDSIALHDGRFIWPLEESNQPSLQLSATNIQSRLRLLPNDEWELDQFTASFAGARLRLTGSITNASALRDWDIFRAPAQARPGQMRERLRELARTIERLKFAGEPELTVDLRGDGRDPKSFRGLLTLRAAGAGTPWGTLSNGVLTARLSETNAAANQPHVQLDLRADEAVTPWAATRGFQLALRVQSDETMTNPVQARLEISADQVKAGPTRGNKAHFEAQWSHALTNAVPLSGTMELRLSDFGLAIEQTNVASVDSVRLTARLSEPASASPSRATGEWAWWAMLEPYPIDWECHLNNIKAEDPQAGTFALEGLAFGGQWRAPALTLSNLHAELYGGSLDVGALLDVATRTVGFNGSVNFDVHRLSPFLPDRGRWLSQYSWAEPPLAHGTGGIRLPAWTNFASGLREDVTSSLWLQGDLKAGQAGYKGVPLTSVQLHFNHSNQVWHLPDLVATRPEGTLRLAHDSDERNHHYYFGVQSSFEIGALRTLAPAGAQRAIDLFQFTQAPVIDAEIWGEWHKPEETGLKAHLTASNFTFRGESVTSIAADVQYTNGFVVVTSPRIERGSNYMTADGLRVDIAGQKIFLTNGFSTMETLPVMHALGSKIAREMEPYKFSQAPTVRASGTIPLDNDAEADLHFQVDGGPFNWTRFNLEHLSGGVDWVGDRVSLTNVNGIFYGGQLAGGAVFDFIPGGSANFAFDLDVSNANLHALIADISNPTNHLEGRLSGKLRVTKANTHEMGSWFGDGNADLRDGFIWEFPIFGIFSQALDTLSPGLGNSRATEGTATFTITNSVIRSEDMDLRGRALSLSYNGTVDFESRVNAVVEAKPLRQTPVLGSVFNVVLMPLTKLFEYDVTGTLSEPKAELKHMVPKILTIPFSPFERLRELIPGGKSDKPDKDKKDNND